jgi:hypothetical protein
LTKKIISPKGTKDDKGAYIKVLPPSAFKLENFLFDKQLKFVTDPRPFKVAVCSRRAGKTVACAADLVHTALQTPDIRCLYITLSRNNAKKLIWPEIEKLNRTYTLGGTVDNTELSITFPNGSIVYLSGAKDSSEIEKFRGLALKKCYIDECQSFRSYIQDLIDDIISPALIDYAGTLALIGTPGPIPSGYFAEVAGVVQGKEEAASAWSHHKWTFFDNPWIETKSGYDHRYMLERELKRRGVTESAPSIQREFFGHWVLDSDSLWIHYDAGKNHFAELPTKGLNGQPLKWNYIMGIDLGFVDADALAVLAWTPDSPVTYLVEEVVMRKQGLSELVDQIQDLRKKYDISRMMIDEGGLGKKLAEEMRRRHGIPVQAADKQRKQENVAFLNDALRTGRFMAKRDSKFAQDCNLVEIDRDKSTPDRIKISDKYHSDIIDSVLYAFKESPGYAYQEPEKKPAKGTKEWNDSEQTKMFEAAQTFFREQEEALRRANGEVD